MADLIANNDAATTQQGVAVNVDVLANDTFFGAPVVLGNLSGPPVVTVPPAHGTAVWSAEAGRFIYTPEPGYCGPDSFEYSITACPLVFVHDGDIVSVEGEIAGFTYGQTSEVTFIAPPPIDASFTLEWNFKEGKYTVESVSGPDPFGESGFGYQPGWTVQIGDAPQQCVNLRLCELTGGNSVLEVQGGTGYGAVGQYALSVEPGDGLPPASWNLIQDGFCLIRSSGEAFCFEYSDVHGVFLCLNTEEDHEEETMWPCTEEVEQLPCGAVFAHDETDSDGMGFIIGLTLVCT